MATGFKIADGYVEIHAALNRRAVRNASNELVRDVNNQVRSNNKDFERTGSHIGQAMGRGASQSLGRSFRVMGMNPYVVAGIAVLAAVISPLLATALTTALVVGLVGMFAFITYFVRKKDKEFKKVWKDLTDGVKDVLKEASEPMVKPLLNSIKIVTDSIKGMSSKLKPIFAGFGTMLEPFTRGMMGLVENMLPGITRGMGGFQAVFKALNEHLPKLGTAIGDFIAELTDDPELIERVVGLMITWLRQFLKIAGPFIEGLMVAFGGMANNWRAFRILWDGFWGRADPGVIGGITGALKDLWGAVKDVWQAYKDLASANSDQEIIAKSQVLNEKLIALWEKLKDTVKAIWETLWNKVKEVWNTTVEPWLKEKMRELLDYLIILVNEKFNKMRTDAIQKVQSFVDGVVAWFLTLPIRILAAIVMLPITVFNVFSQIPGRVQSAISGLPGRVAQVFGDMSTRALYIAARLVGQAVGTMILLPGKVVSAIASLPSRVAAIFTKTRSDGSTIASSTVDRVVGFFRSLPGKAASALGSLGSVVRSAVSGAGGWLVSAGRAIIQGLIDGIRDKIPSLGAALGSLKQFIKDNKGPIEEDRVLLVPEGKAIMEGLQFGINSQVGALRKQLEGITASIPVAATPSRATVSNASSSGSNVTYNFAPGAIVLDASKIQSIQQLMALVNGLRTTSRQFGIRPQVGMV